MGRSTATVARKREAAGQDEQLQVRTWLRLLTSTNASLNYLRCELRDKFGVTLSMFDMLVQIQRPPTGPTMAELSSRLTVTKGHVSALVERMEAKGLVERRSNPHDGRLQHVYLTPKSEALLARMMPLHRAGIAELMAEMDPAMLEELHELLGAFKASVSAAEHRKASTEHLAVARGKPGRPRTRKRS